MLESISAQLVGSLSEAYEFGLSRYGSIWSSAKELLSFTSVSEVSGGIEYQKLSAQDVGSARKRLENMTVW